MIIFTVVNRNHKYILSNFIFYDDHNDYYYYECECKKFKNFYIEYCYRNNTLFTIIYFNYSGYIHREDGPAWTHYDDDGKICIQQYYLNNKKYSYENYVLEINK